ncbi:MAG TPA: SH3 domain-containing protein [Treponemataceae bacterium]|nr:SH3 domain-containing protein [Treponemataceae bacterium]
MKAKYTCFFGFILALSFTLFSCSHSLGFGVVLWSLPEEGLSDGDIVPVFIQSNINQVFVIGIPNSDKKIEVPLWQISTPEKKAQAIETAKKYKAYKNIYARVKLDGLPVRYEATNLGRQVYRLKEGEIVKVLFAGEGAPVNGLEGDWLRVLMQDGSVGWCFSYNLSLFDETDDNYVEEEKKDDRFETFAKKTWYPQSYQTMIQNGRINLDEMKVDYGFSINTETKIASLRLKNITKSFPFEDVEKKEDDLYQLTASPLLLRIVSENQIQVTLVGDFGKQETYAFSTVSSPIRDIIDSEKKRRSFLLQTIINQGPSFSSSNYGLLQFLDEGSFVWTGYSLLSPSLIPSGVGSRGKVSMDYFISNDLSFYYDGVLSFRFDSDQKEIVFLYKLEETGLRMEFVPENLIRNALISSQSQNPIILFFLK